MKESEIESRCMLYANTKGVTQYKFVSPNTRGVPDRVLFYKGQTLFVEFKKRGEVPTRQQELQIRKLRAAGMVVEVVDNIIDGEKVIDSFVYNIDKG